MNFRSNRLQCAGNNNHGQTTPVSSLEVLAVSAGLNHTCTILLEGNRLSCFGANDRLQTLAPSGQYQTVSAGLDYSCGIRCPEWGENPDLSTRCRRAGGSGGHNTPILPGRVVSGDLLALRGTIALKCHI